MPAAGEIFGGYFEVYWKNSVVGALREVGRTLTGLSVPYWKVDTEISKQVRKRDTEIQ